MCAALGNDVILEAWDKVEEALQRAGSYQRVAFDDPIIHLIISDMGGWIYWCRQTRQEISKKWPSFKRRYQHYATLPILPDYMPYVSGFIGLISIFIPAGQRELS